MSRAAWWLAGLALLTLCLAGPGRALAGDKKDGTLKVKEAEVVIDQIMSAGDASIPRDLLAKAKAVAIFPDLIKAGFVVGGQYGTGVVMVRQGDGSWGPPAFFTMGGASLGLQLGAQAADVVMVIMKQRGLDGILSNKVKFGADLAVVAGPVGRRGEASISGASLYADAYSYSRSKGLFAGVSLEGAGLEYDVETTREFYGQNLSVRDVLERGKAHAPAVAQSLMRTLDRHSH